MASRAKSGRGRKRKALDEEAATVEEKKEKLDEVENEEQETGQRVVIEHCFEVTLMQENKEVVLWTGIKKGPPRKLKFPDPAEVVSALEEALKTNCLGPGHWMHNDVNRLMGKTSQSVS
ncbi:Selenoprotein H [Triplophysa tibetana]|uniref:Selenoprotein H n=1 Tax=Triplophysa tibetana TaxID=1572043 RepID=A0A5A9NL60_9TELE|nr:Selenoprotein H [Triplophysa tibetana]